MFSTQDTPTRIILEEIDMKDYTPAKRTDKVKGVRSSILKLAFKMIPSMWKGYFAGDMASENYKKISDKILISWKEEFKKDEYFDVLLKNIFDVFGDLIDAVGLLIAPMIVRSQLSKMFKGENVDDYLVALNMDLPGNPTSEMGHLMLDLAKHTEIQNTKTGEEFEKKLQNKEFSGEFLKSYDTFIEKFGCRGMKEIDIATPRPYEKTIEFFNQLKQINIEDNAIMTVKERKEKAYQKLLKVAKKLGKEKKFIKYAKTQNDMAGYREHPKYFYVVVVDMLRKRALRIGETFKKQGRLDEVNQIFDLTIDQIAGDEKDLSMKLSPLVEKNLAPYEMVKHVKDWPRIIDSRGKIFRPVRKAENGALLGDAISPGIIRGKAKVLRSPYEKKLEKGEILVTRATEPSWTPIFINASGVVLEIGGPLQHGAIIAREYGIPCVSGIEGATNLIKDGDIIEVDGSSGLVKFIK